MDTIQVREVCLGNNISYVLSKDLEFSSEICHLIRSGRGMHVPSMKMDLNGEDAVYFRVDNLARLDYYLHISSKESYLQILEEAGKTLEQIRSGSSLLFENYVLRADRVYVDVSVGHMKLLYLPCEKPVFSDNGDKAAELSRIVIGAVQTGWEADGRVRKGIENLKEISGNLLDYNRRLTQNTAAQNTAALKTTALKTDSGVTGREIKSLRIVGTGSASDIVFTVTKPVFIIGRSPQLCDGVIDISQSVSRSHCRIETNSNHVFISDMNSINGTFVNGIRVMGKNVELKNRDQIKIAGYCFAVEIS